MFPHARPSKRSATTPRSAGPPLRRWRSPLFRPSMRRALRQFRGNTGFVTMDLTMTDDHFLEELVDTPIPVSRVRRRAPPRLSALVPAFRAASAVGGYPQERAASPQGGVRAFAPSRGARYASSGASPAAASHTASQALFSRHLSLTVRHFGHMASHGDLQRFHGSKGARTTRTL